MNVAACLQFVIIALCTAASSYCIKHDFKREKKPSLRLTINVLEVHICC